MLLYFKDTFRNLLSSKDASSGSPKRLPWFTAAACHLQIQVPLPWNWLPMATSFDTSSGASVARVVCGGIGAGPGHFRHFVASVSAKHQLKAVFPRRCRNIGMVDFCGGRLVVLSISCLVSCFRSPSPSQSSGRMTCHKGRFEKGKGVAFPTFETPYKLPKYSIERPLKTPKWVSHSLAGLRGSTAPKRRGVSRSRAGTTENQKKTSMRIYNDLSQVKCLEMVWNRYVEWKELWN